jgi:hypothetical protein
MARRARQLPAKPARRGRHKQCSKHSVQKLYWLVIVAGVAVAAISSGLAAESVSYPEGNAVFTIDVPKGWEAKHEHGAVKIIAEQADVIFLLQRVSNVKDENTAKEALPELAGVQAKQFALEDMKVAIPTANAEMGDFKGFMTECTGKDRNGKDAFWQLMIFSPKDDDYYLVSCLWAKEDAEKTATDRAQIFKSLKAVP